MICTYLQKARGLLTTQLFRVPKRDSQLVPAFSFSHLALKSCLRVGQCCIDYPPTWRTQFTSRVIWKETVAKVLMIITWHRDNGKITVTGRLTMEEAEFSAFYCNGNIYAKANIHSNKKRLKFDL